MSTINTLTGWVNKFLKKEALLDNEKTEARTLIGASPDLTAGPIRSTNGTSSVHSSFGIAQVTGLQGALDGKLPTVNPHISLGGTCDTPPSDDNTQRVANTTWVNNYGASKENILNKLKGTAGDQTRIGAEYMPESIELDYITLGNYAGGTLPEGSLARVGNAIRIANSGGELVDPFSIGGQDYPYGRFVGGRMCEVYEGDGVTLKPNTKSVTNGASTLFWSEVGRFKVPSGIFVDGKAITIISNVHALSASSVGVLDKALLLVPAGAWDVDPQSLYFGSTPTSPGTFGVVSPTFLSQNIFGSNSTSTVGRYVRRHTVASSGSNIVLSSPTYAAAQAVDLTALATQKTAVDNAVDLAALKTATSAAIGALATPVNAAAGALLANSSFVFGQDIEFVVVTSLGKLSGYQTRTIYADITVSYSP